MKARAFVAAPRKFWLYLAVVHLVYAAFFLIGGAALAPPQWPLGVSIPGFVTMVDVIVAPALVYAWIRRDSPCVAAIGAVVIALVGLLVAGAWMGTGQLRAMLTSLPPAQTMAVVGLTALVVGYETRVMVEVSRLWRQCNFDVAISEMTRDRADRSYASNLLSRILAVELRFWAYGLIRRQPQLSLFQGRQHFGYALQSGNASSWTAWAVINAIPAPLIHILLHQTSPVLAAIMTLSTLLSSLWCLAEARAARWRPVSLDDHALYLRYGLTVDRTIPRSMIRSLRKTDWKDLDERDITRHSGRGGANVRLELEGGEIVQLGLDDPTGFVAALSRSDDARMGV